MKSVLHREGWDEFARIGFSREDVSGCQRREIVRLREVTDSVGTSARLHTYRYLDLFVRSFVVPSSIRFDRLCTITW